MRSIAVAFFIFLAASHSWGASAPASSSEARTEAPSGKPAPQLLALERALSQKQQARDAGTFPPEQYQAFVLKFRGDLQSLISRIPPTPANQGLHCMILSRLDGPDREAAATNMARALQANPNSPELLRAQSHILYEQKDFPAAAVTARQAWEAGGQKDMAAWALLKLSEGRVSSAAGSMSETPPPPNPSMVNWAIPPNNDISPQAMSHIQRAIASRKQGDWVSVSASAQAAMNADPTSASVQKFFEAVRTERIQAQETQAFIRNAVQALGAGHGEEAMNWAQKAYERSPGDDTKAILADVGRRSAALPPMKAAEKKPAPKSSSPLLPLFAAGGVGLTALGLYKVALSRTARTSEAGLDPAPEITPEQERANYINSAVLIGAPIIIFALVYGGPPAWRAAAPGVAGLLRGGPKPLPGPSLHAKQPSLQSAAQSLQGAVPQVPAGVSALETAIATRASPLLNAARAQIDARKFTEYALNPLSGDGRNKARVFQSALGYTRENYHELIEQIRTGILSTPAIKGTLDGYGARYTVDIMVTGPKGQAIVRTGWIFEPGNEIPRLTTAFVKK